MSSRSDAAEEQQEETGQGIDPQMEGEVRQSERQDQRARGFVHPPPPRGHEHNPREGTEGEEHAQEDLRAPSKGDRGAPEDQPGGDDGERQRDRRQGERRSWGYGERNPKRIMLHCIKKYTSAPRRSNAKVQGWALLGAPRTQHLCRYITRPTIANERLALNRAGQVVLTLKTPYRDGTTHIVMSPLEFI